MVPATLKVAAGELTDPVLMGEPLLHSGAGPAQVFWLLPQPQRHKHAKSKMVVFFIWE